jgi:hypothetical protein
MADETFKILASLDSKITEWRSYIDFQGTVLWDSETYATEFEARNVGNKYLNDKIFDLLNRYQVPLPWYKSIENLNSEEWTLRVGDWDDQITHGVLGVHGSRTIRSVGYTWMVWNELIPFDPDALYEMSIRVQHKTDGNLPDAQILLCGWECYGADKTTIIGTDGTTDLLKSHFFVSDTTSAPLERKDGYIIKKGYIKGIGASGTAGEFDNPDNPGVAHEDVRYFRPVFAVNSDGATLQVVNGSNSKVDIDSVSIVRVDQDDRLDGKQNISGFPVILDVPGGTYDVSLSYDETTRQVTLTPTGDTADIFVRGEKFIIDGPLVSDAHPASIGGHFYYHNGTDFVWTTDPWQFDDAPICFVYYSTTVGEGAAYFELHTSSRDPAEHRRFHEIDGTQVASGGEISDYVLDTATDAAVTFSVEPTTILDEDIERPLAALPDNGPYTVWYRTGAGGEWVWSTGNSLPFEYGTYPQYNDSSWGLTDIPNGEYANYYLMVVPALDTDQQYILIPGQQSYTTEDLAKEETLASLSFGTLPFQEIAPLYQLTFEAGSGYGGTAKTALVDVTRIIGSKAIVTQTAVQNHNALSSIQGGVSGEYYHLTMSEEESLTGGSDSTLHFHNADRARSSHTGTQPVSSLSDHTVENISDVTLTTIGSNEILKWTGSAWINNTLSEAGIAPTTHNHTAAQITSGTFADGLIAESNVTQHEGALSISESQIGDLDHYDSADFGVDLAAADLEDIGDVTLTTIDPNEILKWSGSAWVNQTLSEAGIAASGHTHSTYIPYTLADVKGDLIVADGADSFARLAAGTDTYVLTADSSTGTGLKWAAASGGANALDDLTDVVISGTPADNELLAYDSGSGDWINQTASEAGLAVSGHNHSGVYEPVLPLTTLGDILIYGSSGLERLPKGSSTYVLTVNDSNPDRIEWAAPAAPSSHASTHETGGGDAIDLSDQFEALGAVATHAGLSDPHTGYQLESEKGANSGYAGLDAGGLVLFSDLPTGTGASQVAIGNHTHSYLSDITGENLEDLFNVVITTVGDEEFLVYDTGTSKWINQTAGELGISTSGHTHAHNDTTSKQGGTGGEYYHLTSAQHTDLTDAGESTLHYHDADRVRSDHTGTQTASTISGGTFADGLIAESNVTQHEGAIDHDQLTNFVGNEHINWVITGAEDIHDDRISQTSVTQHVGAINHDALLNFDADEHIDWTVTGVEDIHVDRISETSVTQHEGAIDHDQLTNFAANEHIDWTVTGVEDIHVDRISETAVTQHEAALSITESQIGDLTHYATSDFNTDLAAADLGDVGDVTLSAIGDGELLRWNGSGWINNTLAEADIAEVEDMDAKQNSRGFPVTLDVPGGTYEVSLSYDSGTRKVTLTPTGGSFDIYVKGDKITTTGTHVSAAHPATLGGHFYFHNGSDWEWNTSPWNFDEAPVCYVYWSTTEADGVGYFELHTTSIDPAEHRRLHEVDGTQIVAGGDLTGYTLDTDTDAAVTFGVDATTILDEDIERPNSALPDNGPYTVWYRTGVGGEWVWNTGNSLPFEYGTYPQYNDTSWGLTDLSNQYSCNYYLLAVPALATNQQYILVPGQQQYIDEADAIGEDISQMAWGTLPFAEVAPLWKLTFKANASYGGTAKTQLINAQRLVGSKAIVNQVGVVNHNALGNIQGGVAGEYFHLTATERAAALEAATDVYTSDDTSGSNAAGTGNSGTSVTSVGYTAAKNNTGNNVIAIGKGAAEGNTYATAIAIGNNADPIAANNMTIGSATEAINTWGPGHDTNSYLDWGTADELRVYTGGTQTTIFDGGNVYLDNDAASLVVGHNDISGAGLRLHRNGNNTYIDYAIGSLYIRPDGGSPNSYFDAAGKLFLGDDLFVQGDTEIDGATQMDGTITVYNGVDLDDYTQSVLGANKVHNGYGQLGNDENFASSDSYSTAENPGGPGGFIYGPIGDSSRFVDNFIPVKPGGVYKFEYDIRVIDADGAASTRFYGMTRAYDGDKASINPYDFLRTSGSEHTRLAAALDPTDTTIKGEDFTNWYEGATGHQRNIGFFPYVGANGHVYLDADQDGTARKGYTKFHGYVGDGTWDQNGIDQTATPDSITIRASGTASSAGLMDNPQGYLAFTGASNEQWTGTVTNLNTATSTIKGRFCVMPNDSWSNITSTIDMGGYQGDLNFYLNTSEQLVFAIRDTGGYRSATCTANPSTVFTGNHRGWLAYEFDEVNAQVTFYYADLSERDDPSWDFSIDDNWTQLGTADVSVASYNGTPTSETTAIIGAQNSTTRNFDGRIFRGGIQIDGTVVWEIIGTEWTNGETTSFTATTGGTFTAGTAALGVDDGSWPSGTEIKNMQSGGTFDYIAGSYTEGTFDWQHISGYQGGTRDAPVAPATTGWRPGTRNITVGWLLSYNTPNGETPTWAIANVELKEVVTSDLVSIDLNDIDDVVISGTPADNEVLAYDSSGDWINQTASEAGLAVSGHDHDADYVEIPGDDMTGQLTVTASESSSAPVHGTNTATGSGFGAGILGESNGLTFGTGLKGYGSRYGVYGESQYIDKSGTNLTGTAGWVSLYATDGNGPYTGTLLVGSQGYTDIESYTSGDTITVTDAIQLWSEGPLLYADSSGTVNVTNSYGVLVAAPEISTATGGTVNLTNSYGIYVEDPAGAGDTITRAIHIDGGESYFGGDTEITGNLTVDTDPSTGDHVGNQDWNDARYVNVTGDTMTGALLLDNDGTNLLPDLAFAGDPNTGIYSSAADTMNFTTGGTEQLTVNPSGGQSGRVNIGSSAFGTYINRSELVVELDESSSTSDDDLAVIDMRMAYTSDNASAVKESKMGIASHIDILSSSTQTLAASLYGTHNYFYADSNQDATGNIYGIYNRVVFTDTNTTNTYSVVYADNTLIDMPTTGLTITEAKGHSSHLKADGGNIGTMYHYHARVEGTSTTVTNHYGLYIDDLIGSTNSYGIYQAGSNDSNYFGGSAQIVGNLTVDADPTTGDHVGNRDYNDTRYINVGEAPTAHTHAHNDTTSIQGGTASQYYHLTSAQHTDLTDSGDSTIHYHATDRARANHTGTQAHTTISDFDTGVRTNRLDQMAAPTATVSMNSQYLSNPLDPTLGTHVGDRDYNDARYINVGEAPTAHTHAHNDTTSKQGGTSGQYYHLTSAQHTDLTDSGDSTSHYHATDRARGNHTGTQVHTTISDFDTGVRTNRLDQMAAPTATVSMNNQTLSSPLDPTAGTHVGDRDYNDGRYALTGHSHAEEYDLEDLGDVTITGPATNDVIQWSGTAWVDKSLSEAGISATGHTHTHNSTTSIQGGSSGQYYHLTSAQHTDLTDSGDSTIHYHATDRARGNHTGTQVHTTISDFDAGVQANRLDQMADPTAALNINSQNLDLVGNIDFGSSVSDKLYFYSNSYGMGIQSNTLTYWSGNTHKFGVGGTSAATTVSQMTITASAIDMQSNTLQGVADPTGATHVGDRGYNDNRYLEVGGDTATGIIYFTDASDASLTDGTGTAQFGANGVVNIGIDGNEIQCRVGGAANTLYLNNHGGNVQVADRFLIAGAGASESLPTIAGSVDTNTGIRWPSGDVLAGHQVMCLP